MCGCKQRKISIIHFTAIARPVANVSGLQNLPSYGRPVGAGSGYYLAQLSTAIEYLLVQMDTATEESAAARKSASAYGDLF